jgi:O-antigen/teichoic acid export membrane protein
VLFYGLPLEIAYGWFTALQVAVAGASMYVLGRVLRLRILPSLFAAVAYMFSGFLIVSVVFTMFLAAVPWLPLLLAVIEYIIRKQEEKGVHSFRPIPYVVAGAIIVGLVVLAGHPELIYYTLLVAGAYSAMRLLVAGWSIRRAAAKEAVLGVPVTRLVVGRLLKLGGWLLAMAVLGVALGAVQLIPLLELLPLNFREGSASLQQVREWAWPIRHFLTFWLPNIFGSPAHHQWFDIWSRQWVPASVNALGEPQQTIFWGIKNYVEGGNYLGIATWLLAAVGVLAAAGQAFSARRPQAHLGVRTEQRAGAAAAPGGQEPNNPVRRHPAERQYATWFFLGLAVVSLLFAFGTPLYALLYYGLPGWNQLHSPFRWVFPFTLSMAALAGIGLNWLLGQAQGRRVATGAKLIAGLVALAGVGALAAALVSAFVPGPFAAFGQRVVDGSDLAQMAFADGGMFWSYQAANLAAFGAFALGSGVLVWLLAARHRVTARHRVPSRHSVSVASGLAAALIGLTVLDLFVAHGHFNPASDPSLSPRSPQGTPPVVTFLNEREAQLAAASPLGPADVGPANAGTWRFTTFNVPGEKTFNANVGMYYGWHDLRGYDSIIPRQYAELMSRIQPQDDELLYNRIAPLYAEQGGDVYAVLDNPLLDLLNVKYVLTEHAIPNPAWREIYRDASIGVYENTEVLPRVILIPEARVLPADQQPLTETDLRRVLFIEEPPADSNALTPSSPQVAEARISRYTAEEVFVDVNLSDRSWLLLSDAYFPGWKAYIRPFGGGESEERELAIQRANGALRAVYLPEDGQWTVRFVYSPMSFRLGLYLSFLAMMTLLLLLLYWAWGRYYRPEIDGNDVQRVAKNSLVPMGLSLTNKAIDFAFAMLYVRLLGPVGTGQYYFVVAIYGFFEIISRYGLGTLLTRDVAADKNQSSRYLTNVVAVRTLLWAVCMPLMALVVLGYRLLGNLFPGVESIGPQEIEALVLLGLAMLFANYADALSSMFHAFEKMEYPAGLTNAVALIKVTLGALVLLLGWGFVGLAGVALVVNILQVIWLYALLRATLFQPQWKWDWPLQVQMVRMSGPLMINHLLATIFWRIDVWILRPIAGAAAVGLYSIGLKYLDGLNIIPAVSTMAIFPLMSRFARAESNSLLRAYVLSLRLLTMISLPIAMAVTFLARPLVYLVGGAEYLDVPGVFHIFGQQIPYMGGADLAFQVIIWSIPIGFVNSVTQYVLIAVNQQHYLTRAFILGVVFNVVGNLILIPRLGYVGAALATIFSEFSLLFPFYYSVRRNVGTVPWLRVFGPPLLAVALMGLATFGLVQAGTNVWLAVAGGGIVYLVGLLLTGALRGEDMATVLRALPIGPLRRLVTPVNAG